MITCPKNDSIAITGGCPDWSTLAFAVAPTKWHQGLFTTYPLTFTLVGGVFTLNATPTDGLGNHFALYNSSASLLFTGGPCNCQLDVNITNWTFDALVGNGGIGFRVVQDGFQKAIFTRVNGQSAGAFNVPFTLVAGINSVVELRVGLFDPGFGGPVDTVFMYGYDDAPLDLACTATLSNV